MNRVKLGMLSLGLVVGFVVVGASCSGTQGSGEVPPTVPVRPTATAVATAAPTAAPSAGASKKPVDLNDPKQVSVASWTDDDAIAALAKDCHWDPGNCVHAIEIIAPNSIEGIEWVPEGQKQSETDTRTLPSAVCQSLEPLACARIPGQSCVPDACSQSDYDCYPKCDATCVSCAGKCVTSCESCKAPCKDDACRLACAKSCGECRNKCLQELDHCTTATCSEAEETCFRERDDNWNKSTCPKVCPKVQDCVEKCPPIENDYTGELYVSDCAKKCFKNHGKGCPAEFDRICAGDPNHSVNFNAYHANRAASK